MPSRVAARICRSFPFLLPWRRPSSWRASIASDDSYGLFCDGSVVETAPAVATLSPSALVMLPTIDDLLLGVPTSRIQPARWAKLNKEIKSKGRNPKFVLKRPVAGAVVDEQTAQTKTRTTKQCTHNKTKKIPKTSDTDVTLHLLKKGCIRGHTIRPCRAR